MVDWWTRTTAQAAQRFSAVFALHLSRTLLLLLRWQRISRGIHFQWRLLLLCLEMQILQLLTSQHNSCCTSRVTTTTTILQHVGCSGRPVLILTCAFKAGSLFAQGLQRRRRRVIQTYTLDNTMALTVFDDEIVHRIGANKTSSAAIDDAGGRRWMAVWYLACMIVVLTVILWTCSSVIGWSWWVRYW